MIYTPYFFKYRGRPGPDEATMKSLVPGMNYITKEVTCYRRLAHAVLTPAKPQNLVLTSTCLSVHTAYQAPHSLVSILTHNHGR